MAVLAIIVERNNGRVARTSSTFGTRARNARRTDAAVATPTHDADDGAARQNLMKERGGCDCTSLHRDWRPQQENNADSTHIGFNGVMPSKGK